VKWSGPFSDGYAGLAWVAAVLAVPRRNRSGQQKDLDTPYVPTPQAVVDRSSRGAVSCGRHGDRPSVRATAAS